LFNPPVYGNGDKQHGGALSRGRSEAVWN